MAGDGTGVGTFYVYNLIDADNVVHYVGKGTGRRIKAMSVWLKRSQLARKLPERPSFTAAMRMSFEMAEQCELLSWSTG